MGFATGMSKRSKIVVTGLIFLTAIIAIVALVLVFITPSEKHIAGELGNKPAGSSQTEGAQETEVDEKTSDPEESNSDESRGTTDAESNEGSNPVNQTTTNQGNTNQSGPSYSPGNLLPGTTNDPSNLPFTVSVASDLAPENMRMTGHLWNNHNSDWPMTDPVILQKSLNGNTTSFSADIPGEVTLVTLEQLNASGKVIFEANYLDHPICTNAYSEMTIWVNGLENGGVRSLYGLRPQTVGGCEAG